MNFLKLKNFQFQKQKVFTYNIIINKLKIFTKFRSSNFSNTNNNLLPNKGLSENIISTNIQENIKTTNTDVYSNNFYQNGNFSDTEKYIKNSHIHLHQKKEKKTIFQIIM